MSADLFNPGKKFNIPFLNILISLLTLVTALEIPLKAVKRFLTKRPSPVSIPAPNKVLKALCINLKSPSENCAFSFFLKSSNLILTPSSIGPTKDLSSSSSPLILSIKENLGSFLNELKILSNIVSLFSSENRKLLILVFALEKAPLSVSNILESFKE